MLQFVFGRAASGKTHWIHQAIKQERNNSNHDVILLVPEQFTFETEREMLSLLGDGFMSEVSVLSFTRLCETAGQRYGGVAGIRVTEAQRMILLGNAFKKLAGHLELFQKYVGSAVFIRQLALVISELKTAGVSSETLMQAAGDMKPKALSKKLSEIAMIYAAYDAELKGIYIDPLDELERFYQTALEHGFFRGKTVYIDAFKGFTGAQLKVLKLLIAQAERVVVSFCSDGMDDQGGVGVFSNVVATAELLKKYAENQHIPVLEPIHLTDAHFQNPALRDLELVLSGKGLDASPVSTEGVTLLQFETPLQELEYVFKTIHKLVRTQGYRYEDFVLIARDITKYERRIALAAEKYEVPCYMDQRRGLMSSPIARFVLSLLHAAKDFSSEHIFALLKTGFYGLNQDEIARLEEYVYIWSIEKQAWQKDWDMEPSGLVGEHQVDAEKSTAMLADLNGLRKRVMLPLFGLRKTFDATVPELCKAIYDCMLCLHCDTAVKRYCEELIAKNSGDDADFVMDSWDAVMAVLDDMVRCYGEATIPIAEFIDMMELAFSGLSLGTLPRMIDEVSCGSADRIRPGRPKIVFVIGLGQGEFPAPAVDSGILLKSDRIRLEEAGIAISDQFRRFAIEEGFLAYTSLCCATQRVYALRHAFEFDGSSVEESSVYSRIKAVFGEGTVSALADLPETAAEGFDQLAADFHGSDAKAAGLRGYFSGRPDYAFRVAALERAKQRTERRLSSETADAIFSKDIYLSASKLEVYNKCPFSYFCKYVLKLGRLQKADLDQLQRGTIVHHVLEQVLRELGAGIANATEAQIDQLIDGAMQSYLSKIRGFAYLEVPRFQFLFGEIAKMLRYLIRHISSEFQNSDFVPKAFELDIAEEGEVPALRLEFTPNKHAVVTGQIDRVDVFEDPEGRSYVRIVDYKTGKKAFYLSDVLYGLNLQMLLYLYILRRNGQGTFAKSQPAGILYMPSNRGMVKQDGTDPLVMNGMLLNDEAVLKAMDKQETGRYVPKRPTRERAADPMISAEEFETVFDFVERQVTRTATQISRGIFDLCPRDGTESKACKYCDFADVCGVEQSFERKQTKKQSNRVILEKMKEAEADGNKMD